MLLGTVGLRFDQIGVSLRRQAGPVKGSITILSHSHALALRFSVEGKRFAEVSADPPSAMLSQQECKLKA